MILRQLNILGQMRLDVPHIRSMESSVAADFDVLAGAVMSGGRALVVKGFDLITVNAVGSAAAALQLNTAGGVLLHGTGSEAGTIFSVPAGTPVETLSGTNPVVIGAFTANQANYVGLDLRRTADDSTADLALFLDANTLLEAPRSIPLGRTLGYRIYVSTTDFTATPQILPLAIVTTDATNTVTAIQDARQMAWRLGSGSSVPNRYHAYPWAAGRQENTSGAVFAGGDKAITSLKDWADAVMTRLWEVGGGQYWYSPTADREVKLAFGQPVIVATGDNFQWTLGSQTLQWQSLAVIFGNSTVNSNLITDGSAVLLDGQCLYVDIDRSAATTLNPAVATLTTLGTPTVPGSRFIIAWRQGVYVYTREKAQEVGRSYNVATTVADGMVRLKNAAGNPADPIVLAADANGAYSNTATSGSAFIGVGQGTGAGFDGTGGTTSGPGIKGTGGAANGKGGVFQGTGTGAGVTGTGGSGAGNVPGGAFTGGAGAGNSDGVQGQGHNGGAGGSFTGGATGAGSVSFAGGANLDGSVGIGGGGTGAGVHGFGTGGLGGLFETTGSATGLKSTGGSTGGKGAEFFGGGTSGLGVDATGGAPVGVTVGGDAIRGTGSAAVANGSTPGMGGVFVGGSDGNGAVGGGIGLKVTGGSSNTGADGGIGLKVTGGGGDNGGPCVYLDTSGNTGPALRTNGLSTAGQPTAPIDGDLYYDTTIKVWRQYNSDVVATVDPSDVTQTTGEWSMTKHLTRNNGSVGNGDPVLKGTVSSGNPAYYLDSNRKVQIRGIVVLSGTGSIFVLPPGFRPAQGLAFMVSDTTAAGATTLQATVSTAGVVAIPASVVAGHGYDLSVISFASAAVVP